MDVFCPTKFYGCGPPISCTKLFSFAVRHVEKFREVFQPKVMGAHTLNFNSIFECSLLKIVGEPPSPVGRALASLSHSLAHVKCHGAGPSIGAEIRSSEKI